MTTSDVYIKFILPGAERFVIKALFLCMGVFAYGCFALCIVCQECLVLEQATGTSDAD